MARKKRDFTRLGQRRQYHWNMAQTTGSKSGRHTRTSLRHLRAFNKLQVAGSYSSRSPKSAWFVSKRRRKRR